MSAEDALQRHVEMKLRLQPPEDRSRLAARAMILAVMSGDYPESCLRSIAAGLKTVLNETEESGS